MDDAKYNNGTAVLGLRADDVKRAAAGRWLEILTAAGMPADILDGRHHPCPKCGGKDRFRAFDDFPESGACMCNQCLHRDNGDGLAVIQWLLDCDFRAALFGAAKHLGMIRPVANTDIVAAVAAAKRMPADSLRKFGGESAKRGKKPVVRFPVYDETGQAHSHFDLTADGKGWFRAGAGSSGLFLPGRKPKPGEKWFLVEGVKDAAALDGLGYTAAGLPRSEMATKYAPLFAGCDVIVVPDLDQPGQSGAQTTAARLKGVATSVLIARLPGPIAESGGRDVRDMLASDGETAVRQAIENALPAIENENSQEGTPAFIRASIDVADLCEKNLDREWLVNRAVAKSEELIIGGPEKCLKTAIMADLLVSLATGGQFLNSEKFDVARPVKTAFLTCESGDITVKNLVRRIARAKMIHTDQLRGWLTYSPEVPVIANDTQLDYLAKWITDEQFEVVAIDPTYLALFDENTPVQSSDVLQMGPLLRRLTKIRKQTGCTLILAHHTRKKARENRWSDWRRRQTTRQDLAQAGFAAWMRQWILITRRREYEHNGRHEMHLEIGGSAGHSGEYVLEVCEGKKDVNEEEVLTDWSLNVTPSREFEEGLKETKEQREAEKQDQKLKRLLDVINSEPETKSNIFNAAGFNGTNGGPILHELLRRGWVERCDCIKSGRKYEGFRRAKIEKSDKSDENSDRCLTE